MRSLALGWAIIPFEQEVLGCVAVCEDYKLLGLIAKVDVWDTCVQVLRNACDVVW